MSASTDSLQIEAGSVDEHSTKSDEEYDDLAMQDVMENGDCSDDDDAVEQVAWSGASSSRALDESILMAAADGGDALSEGRYHHSNLDLFFKMSNEVAAKEMPCA